MPGVGLIAGKRRNRVVTALVLLPAAVGCIYLQQPYSAILFFLAGALGLYEWAGLARWTSAWQRGAFVVAYTLLALLGYASTVWQSVALWTGVVVWFFAIVGLLGWVAWRTSQATRRGSEQRQVVDSPGGVAVPRAGRTGRRFEQREAVGSPGRPLGPALFESRWLIGTLGVFVIWSAWAAILAIHKTPNGSNWLLWIFALIWGADIGAYFVGKRYGKRPLAPSLSPGKTWEGAMGGAAVAATACLGALAAAGTLSWAWVGTTLLLIAVSIFGDLLESLLKRSSGVKDSGTLLPGHGGVLDRIDSALPVLPVFALVLGGI